MVEGIVKSVFKTRGKVFVNLKSVERNVVMTEDDNSRKIHVGDSLRVDGDDCTLTPKGTTEQIKFVRGVV